MIYRFGLFEFDDGNGELRKESRPLALERQPGRVLGVLLARAGDLVSREELREHVWGSDTHVDFDRGLAYCISQIRSALGDRSDSPRFVQTFPRRGYKFIAPVSAEAPVVPPADPNHRTTSSEPAAIAADTRAWPRVRPAYVLAAVALALLLAALLPVGRPVEPVLIAVSVFDNETGVADYDQPIAGLSDLVVVSLATLAPGRLAVIGNADVLRRPRNIRNLKAVADALRADYVLLGQLQQGEQGLRFITHFIRLRDLAHLKANRLPVNGTGIAGLEQAVVHEFERATREHVLRGAAN